MIQTVLNIAVASHKFTQEVTMLDDKKKKVISSLQDLNPNDFPKEKSGPINIDVDLGDINFSLGDDDKQIKKIEQSAEGIKKWVKTYLAKLDQLRVAPKAIRIRTDNQVAAKRIHDKIDSFMNHTEAAYRQAAWIAFLVHKIKNAPVRNYLEAMQWFEKMVKDGYLEKGDYRAQLRAWKGCFQVPEIACFTQSELDETKHAVHDLVTKITQTTAKSRQSRVAELQKISNLVVSQVFDKDKEGQSLLFVPPQISTKTGKEPFVRKEGFLFVDVKKGGKIYPLEGVGGFEKNVAEAANLGIFIWASSLDLPWPPGQSRLLNVGLSEEQANACFICWFLLKRAKTLLEQTNQHQEEKLELSREISISEEDFFLNGSDGYALVDFEGVWEILTPEKKDESGKKQNKKDICSLFLLIGRKEGIVSIIACPEHLKVFFSNCMEAYSEGQQFLGVPQPLRSVLQAQYGAMQTKNLLCS